MKKITQIAIFILFSQICFSQSLDLQIISATGGISQNEELHWTLGETLIGGNSKLTQGFHQGKLIVTSINSIEGEIEIIVYPNPTQNGVFIKTDTFNEFKMRLVDLQGKQLLSNSIKQFPHFVDLGSYSSGLYLIQLFNDKQILKTFKIEKIK